MLDAHMNAFVQFRMFSLSAPEEIYCAFLFSSIFCSNLAFAAAALSGGTVLLALEFDSSIVDKRLDAIFAVRLPPSRSLVDLCLERSSDFRGRTIAALGGLDAMLNMEGRGLGWQLRS